MAQLFRPTPDAPTSVFDLVRRWSEESPVPVELLPCDPERGARAVATLSVSRESALAAVVSKTGGIVVDRGWLRILGGGSHRMPRSVPSWNCLFAPAPAHRLPGVLLVADDVVGGFFAVNRGGLEGTFDAVFYFSPETLEWQDLGIGYTNWLCWVLTGPLGEFYAPVRWPGWEREVSALVPATGIACELPLCMEGPQMGARVRRPVSMEELWGLHTIELPQYDPG